MNREPPPRDGNGNRRDIRVTCTVHGAVQGYTNLVVRKPDGNIELDAHATGACALSLTEPEARELHAIIEELLG